MDIRGEVGLATSVPNSYQTHNPNFATDPRGQSGGLTCGQPGNGWTRCASQNLITACRSLYFEINQARAWRGATLALRDFSLSLVHGESVAILVARVRPDSRFHRRPSTPDRGAFFFHRVNTHFHRGASRRDRDGIEIHRF